MMTDTQRPALGQWSSEEELAALVDKQLPCALARAARSPFYRRVIGSGGWPASRGDLLALPLTSKQDLRDNYPFGMLAVGKDELATYHESSGTAGQPTPSYYTADDWEDLAERYARKWIGITADDIFMVRTPYALMITGHLAHAAARLHGATVVPADNRSLAMPYSRVIRVLHDLGVTLTWSMPTETLIWAAAAKAAGYEPASDFPTLRALFVGGEPLSQLRRERVSRIWGVPVIEEYGSTETGSLAGECQYGNLHLWADRAVFEVYNPDTGKISEEGSGQLVVTPLFRQAMPLLRYNLEDDVQISYATCRCGWHLPAVRVFGRASFGYRVGSAKVTQHQLEELVFGLPAEYQVMFWRAKAEPAVLRIEIEVPESVAREACGALGQAVRGAYGDIPCEVTGHSPGTLVPARALTATQDVIKPRSLFGEHDDWSKALLYH